MHRVCNHTTYFVPTSQEGVVAMEKVEELTKEVKQLRDENKTLSDNYNSERVSSLVCLPPILHLLDFRVMCSF